MKLRIILTAFATALAALAVGNAGAASASDGACVGQGKATLGAGLYAVGLGADVTTTFSITINCLNGGTVTAGGTLTGRCGLSTGTGTLNGRPFTLQTAGSTLELTPRSGSHVVGAGNAVADPGTANNSCVDGTAKVFLVTGTVTY